MGSKTFFLPAVFLAVLTVVAACGGGGGGGGGASSPAATLQSIAVTPSNPSIAAAATKQFSATGTYSDGTSQDITASLTWTSSNTGIATVSASGLATGVAAGTTTITATSGTISGSTSLTVTTTSTAGINWTVSPPPFSSLAGVTWSGTQFVAVGASGTIRTSTDGITWTTRTAGTTNNLNGITWSGTQFVAVGASGTILTSPDGIAWTTQTSNTTNNLNGIVWSGNQFVAVGASGTVRTSNPDRRGTAINWHFHASWSARHAHGGLFRNQIEPCSAKAHKPCQGDPSQSISVSCAEDAPESTRARRAAHASTAHRHGCYL